MNGVEGNASCHPPLPGGIFLKLSDDERLIGRRRFLEVILIVGPVRSTTFVFWTFPNKLMFSRLCGEMSRKRSLITGRLLFVTGGFYMKLGLKR